MNVLKYLFVEIFFWGAEPHPDRQGDEGFALCIELFGQSGGLQTLQIFLRSEHELKGFGFREDGLYILRRKTVMIGVGE